MSEDTMPDDVDLNAQPPAPTEGIAGPLRDIDPETMEKLQERLKEFKKNSEGTKEDGAAPVSQFDLEKWEVDPELEHLYRRATQEGNKWIVIEHQYMILNNQWHVDNGGQPRVQGSMVVKDKQGRIQYHAKGLDQIISEIINGPEGMLSREKGWRLSALLPGQMGQGVAVLERQVKRELPEPKPIVKPEEQPLEKTTDEELARMQEKAQEWAGAPDVEAAPDAVEGGQ